MNPTQISPWRSRPGITSIALYVAFVLTMAAAFAEGTRPAGTVLWALAVAALAGAVFAAHRASKAAQAGALR